MSLADSISGHDRRTLDLIFSHPISSSVHWKDVVHLIEAIGSVTEEHNSKYIFEVGTHRDHFHMPHSKELTAPELLEIREFLKKADVVPGVPEPTGKSDAALGEKDAVIVIDHHGAHVFVLEGDSAAGTQTLRPYDPHHFLHHLAHKDQAYKGQRAPEDDGFYERIAEAVAAVQRILIVSHGTGESNAGEALEHWLKHKHGQIYARVVDRVSLDTSALSDAELLSIAKHTFTA